MNNDNPVVTVVTAVLNNAATIDQCIDSVARQDYGNIEHLIIDGGSTDGTREILEKQGCRFTSEADSGIYDAFNKGIARASGEFIQFLNADDYFKHQHVVSRMVEFMLKHQLDVAHARVEQVDSTGKVIKTIGQDVSRSRLLRKCRVAHPSVFTRRSVFESFGKFSTSFRIAGDHEFLLRIWGRVKTGFLPEVVTVMRLGGMSNSNIRMSYQESMAAAILHGQSPVAARANYYYEILKAAGLKGLRMARILPGATA